MKKYSIGLDYGTESVRAILVDTQNGDTIAVSVEHYLHGIMSPCPDFALQDPQDYLDSGWKVLKEVASKVSKNEIIGIGVDFTACTMFPVDAKGEPLCFNSNFKDNHHAYAKLWKHHGAKKEADEINRLATVRGEKFLDYYGGIISCEWMLPKVFETLRCAPEVFNQTKYFVDAGDWIVFKLTGSWVRSATFAGYKGLWSKEEGYPSKEFLNALDPRLENIASTWISPVMAPGTLAGLLSVDVAKELGLQNNIGVSVATIDAHSGVPGMGVYSDRTACFIMGTSSCHMFLSGSLHLFKGMAGAVHDGIIPGLIGYESGQAAVGDLFAWFVKKFLKDEKNLNAFEVISKEAYSLKPGAHGLVALDWMNGNRSILMNHNLTGNILGLTLDTTSAEVFRALVEGTAFGTKKIIETYRNAGIVIDNITVCGGLSLLDEVMQIYSDILEMPINIAESNQAVALGAAIFGALACGKGNGGYDHIEEAVTHMVKPALKTHSPNPDHFKNYREIYKHYKTLHDFFGVDHPEIMQELKELKLNNNR